MRSSAERPVLGGPGEVAEHEAGPALARTYADLRAALGVPFIPTLYRVLGTDEPFLTAATGALRDVIGGAHGAAFAAEARRLGAAADLPQASLDVGPDAPALLALIDEYNRANPRNLLFALALAPRAASDPFPSPAGALAVGADAAALLADIGACHGDAVMPGLWREVAASHPTLLAPAWHAIRGVLGTPAFEAARADVVGAARATVAAAAAPAPATPAALVEPLAWFARGISTMIVEIELLRRLVAAAA